MLPHVIQTSEPLLHLRLENLIVAVLKKNKLRLVANLIVALVQKSKLRLIANLIVALVQKNKLRLVANLIVALVLPFLVFPAKFCGPNI